MEQNNPICASANRPDPSKTKYLEHGMRRKTEGSSISTLSHLSYLSRLSRLPHQPHARPAACQSFCPPLMMILLGRFARRLALPVQLHCAAVVGWACSCEWIRLQ